MFQHTQQPITTGTSCFAMKFEGGVIMAADTLGSYGSLARFTDLQRIMKVIKYSQKKKYSWIFLLRFRRFLFPIFQDFFSVE